MSDGTYTRDAILAAVQRIDLRQALAAYIVADRHGDEAHRSFIDQVAIRLAAQLHVGHAGVGVCPADPTVLHHSV